MNCLPSDWTSDRLKDIAEINADSLPASTDPDYEFDYLEISNVDCHGIVDLMDIERLRYEDAPSRARRRVAKGNTVISSVRPNLQAVAYMPNCREDLVCSTGFNVVQSNQKRLHSHFAYFTLISEDARQYFEATAKGVGYPAVDDKDFTTFNFTLPLLPEQERISTYLEASCATIDVAVTAKRQQLETLEKIYQETLHCVFSNKNWPTDRIKDVATKIGSGVTPEGGAAVYLDEGVPLLRSQNIHFDGLRLDDVAYISDNTHAAMSNSQLKPGDVLVNITGASIGRCTFVPENFEKGNVNQHVCIIRCNHKISHRFLAFFLSSQIGQGQILSLFTGASRQGLSHKDLGKIIIPLPSIQLQRNSVEKIEAKKKQLRLVSINIGAQISTLLAYRKSLIHECVTGQSRITEADVTRVTSTHPACGHPLP